MMKTKRSALGLALGLLALTSCVAPEPAYQEARVDAPSDRVLWKVTLLSIQKMGYPITGGLDPRSGKVQSGWKSSLAPFKGEGYRTRAEVNLSPVEEGVWKVQARVEKEINQALVNPLDPSRAEWKATGDDDALAGILIQHIRSFLDPRIELTEEPEDPIEAFLERTQSLEED